MPLGVEIPAILRATDAMNARMPSAHFRILATSDTHMHVTGWDPLRDEVVGERGMDVLAHKIEAARLAAQGDCILVDNGDSVQGTPVGETCAAWPADHIHPWAAVANAIGYDAVGLGNHDFDFGIPFLEQVVAQTDAPTLCASFDVGHVEGVAPMALLPRRLRCSDGEVRALMVGITSVLPPQTVIWNHAQLSGRLTFLQGLKAAKQAVQAVRDAGADIVVMLCHSGLIDTENGADSENFAAAVAAEVAGIDAMVLGHTHEYFPVRGGPRSLHGVPAVMPGYGAQALGAIDLELDWTATGWRVTNHHARLITPHESDTPRPDITALSAPAIAETRDRLNTVVAHTDTGFHSYFEMLRSGLASALVARAMMHSLRDQIAQTDLAGLPMLASVATFLMGGRLGPRNFVEVPRGAVRARHLAMLSPFTDTISGMVMTGAELRAWSERSAAFFAAPLESGRYLVEPDAPAFNFDILHGVEAVVDPRCDRRFDLQGVLVDPSAQRVQSLNYQGAPVADDARFVVAMTSYRGAGGGAFPRLASPSDGIATQTTLGQALHDVVRSDPSAFDPAPSVWRFVGDSDTRVLIETSPHARAHLHEIAGFDPKIVGLNQAGFLELDVAI